MTDVILNRATIKDGKLIRETVKVTELTITEDGEDREYIWFAMKLEDGSEYQTPYFKGTS
jgi:hypothetical protein